MRYARSLATAAVLVCIVGCASGPKVAVQEPVGPSQRIAAGTATGGSLVVYSARRPANVNLNTEAFLWNNDAGRNEFMYEPGHTDFTIYDSDGRVLQSVRNAGRDNVEDPTPVSLPTGVYTVEAEAEASATATMTVLIPVVVEAGQTTTVHLEPTWQRPAASREPGNVVRLYDGRVIGYRAQPMVGLNTP
jgi:hypothetical protein